MIDLEKLAEMRLAAQMCDDYSVYKREMAEIDRLERDLGIINRPPVDPQPMPKVERIPSRGHKAKSVSHALELMDQLINGNRKQQES